MEVDDDFDAQIPVMDVILGGEAIGMVNDVNQQEDEGEEEAAEAGREEEEEKEEVVQVSTTRDVLPYENWAEAVSRPVEDPLPESVLQVMNNVFHNDMLVENILEKVIQSRDRATVRSCRLVSKQWTIATSKLYRKMKKPLFLVNTNKDLYTHNDPPRPIFDHHSVLCEFLRPVTRHGRIESFIPTFALHLSHYFFRKCNYNDLVNCLVQCGPSLVELFITFPKNSHMSFLLPPGISLPNLITMGVSFTGQTLHNSLHAGPFAHQHEYFPNHSSIHLVQSILNAASNLRNFSFTRCQNPMNPPDMENLYLPDKLVSLKIETPLRGFELLMRKHFENLAELTLNPSMVIYSEGEVYELLSKLSSTLRVLILSGNPNQSYRHSLPVKLPRMETLTKFVMFKPWEFEVRNPPLSFDEILPKMETLVFATQTEAGFSYLMSGMRSTTITSFSVWLTSAGSYRPQPMMYPVPAGFRAWVPHPNPLDVQRLIPIAQPFVIPPRIELDLLPARDRDPARMRFRARRAFMDRNRRLQGNGDDEARRLIERIRAPARPIQLVDEDVQIVHEQQHRFQALQPPLVQVVPPLQPPLHQLQQQRPQDQHIMRLRQGRVRVAAYHLELQRRGRELMDLEQQQQRRMQFDVGGDGPVEPRIQEVRRRLQEMRGRINPPMIVPEHVVLRRDNANRPPERAPEPALLRYVQNRQGEFERPPPPPPINEPEIYELSSTDSEDEMDDMMRIRSEEPREENGRLQPLQVLAAAAIAGENMGLYQRDLGRGPGNDDNNEEARENQQLQPNQRQRVVIQVPRIVNGNNDAPRLRPRVRPPPVDVFPEDIDLEEQGRVLAQQLQVDLDNGNDVDNPLLDLRRVGNANGVADAPNANNENGAQGQPNGDVQADGGARGMNNPRVRAMRRLHNQLLDQYRRHRPGRQQQPHHLPERPVTMTKEKMQQINVAFINLTKLKINICGPEICGLKYIFEEMKSLQVLNIVVEKSIWPIKWDSLLTGIPVEFCEAIKCSSELWDEVYLHENQVSIRSLTKLEELGILECLKVNEQTVQDGQVEEHLISDVAFHFSLLKIKNLKHLVVTPGFFPSSAMTTKWYQEKGFPIKMKQVGRMDTEYERY